MAVTIPVIQGVTNRAVLTVMARTMERGKSLPFERTYVPANTYGFRYLYPGMIVAHNNDKTKYVPATSGASYGAYSDYTYAVGIVDDFFDFTLEEQFISPAVRGTAVEEYCYVFGGSLGTVHDNIKAAQGMKLIQWG